MSTSAQRWPGSGGPVGTNRRTVGASLTEGSLRRAGTHLGLELLDFGWDWCDYALRAEPSIHLRVTRDDAGSETTIYRIDPTGA